MLKYFHAIIISLTLATASTAAIAADKYRDLFWEDMAPAEAEPAKEYSLDDLHNLDQVMAAEEAKDDSIGREVMPELAGQRVKLPAYVVPLENDGKITTEFLLVPYFGACIHVPPPPQNQIIYGISKAGISGEMFDAVWAYGKMQIETTSSELAEASYSMVVDKVEPMDLDE